MSQPAFQPIDLDAIKSVTAPAFAPINLDDIPKPTPRYVKPPPKPVKLTEQDKMLMEIRMVPSRFQGGILDGQTRAIPGYNILLRMYYRVGARPLPPGRPSREEVFEACDIYIHSHTEEDGTEVMQLIDKETDDVPNIERGGNEFVVKRSIERGSL